MTRSFVGLALWVISGLASAAFSQTDAAAGTPRIALFWSDYKLLQNKLSAGARKALEKEAQSIFSEAGIQLSFFVRSPEDHGASDARAIRVILMSRSAEGWSESDDAMGAILERNARARTVYVFVPVVERTIGHSVDDRMLHGRKAHALARALARVLAHETVHAIDSNIPHGPEGSVMSANLTSELLLAHRVTFDGTTKARLLESLFKPATARTPHP